MGLFPDLESRCTVATDGPSFNLDSYYSSEVPQLPQGTTPNDRYILAVGRIEKRKNIDLLVRAFERANLKGIKLIIVGKQDIGFRWHPPENDNIVHLQNLPDDQLLSLYRHASLFAFPSRAEGFGIPLLDALLAGCPVISSNQTSMPEVAPGYAWLFDPTASDAEIVLANAIVDHFVRRPLSPPTLDQRHQLAERFNWNRSAKILAEIINEALHEETDRQKT